jgi:hypothetical protein
MNRLKPPRVPAWMLEHFKTGGSNEALAGDLVEEFRSGRSNIWYWRQVLAALLIGWLKNIREHRNLMVFAALWSMLAPGWMLVAMRAAEGQAEAWHVWRLNWPWSSLCSAALFFVPGLIFLWVGIASYLVTQMLIVKHFNMWRIGRGLLLSIPFFVAISGALTGSVLLFQVLSQTEVQHQPTLSIAPAAPNFVPKTVGGGREVTVIRDKHGVATVQSTTRVYVVQNSPWAPKPFRLDRNGPRAGTLSPLGAITETGIWSIVNRLPSFLSLLFALWARRRTTSDLKSILG